MLRQVRPARWRWAAACWSVTALALWLGAAVVCPAGHCHVPALDKHLLDAVFAARTPWLDVFLTYATWLGSMAVLAPAALLIALLFKRVLPLTEAWFPAFALTGAWLIAHAAKFTVARPRPALHPALIEMPVDASFPSAHAMQICAFALACALIAGAKFRAAALAAATVVLLIVAVSRLYLQVHFPSDIMAGIVAFSRLWQLLSRL